MLERRLDQYFAELRSLLQQRPHAHRWERVCWYAERIAILDSDHFEQAVAPYIQASAASWPDATRLIPARWFHYLGDPELPELLRLCRGISLKRLFGYAPAQDDLVRACVELRLSFIDSDSTQWSEASMRRVLLGGYVRHLGIRVDGALSTLIEAGSPCLESLTLQTSAPAALEQLRGAKWPKLRALSLELDWAAQPITPTWGESDSAWVSTLELEALSLSLRYGLGQTYVTGWHLSLFTSSRSQQLKRLGLTGLMPCDGLEDWLISLPLSLESLELEFISSPPPQALARGLRARQLRELSLHRVSEVGRALDDWFFSSQAQALERLELVRCAHADAIVEHLYSPAAPRGLRTLILDDVTLEQPLVWPSKPAPWCASIEQLSLSLASPKEHNTILGLLGWVMPRLLALCLRWLGAPAVGASLERCAPTLHTLQVHDLDAIAAALLMRSAPDGVVELELEGEVLAALDELLQGEGMRRLERLIVGDYRADAALADALLAALAKAPGAAQLLFVQWPKAPSLDSLEQLRSSSCLHARFALSYLREDVPAQTWFSRTAEA